MSDILEQRLISPRELAEIAREKRVNLGLTTQWKRRSDGSLKFLQCGGRVYYTPKMIQEFFLACEQNVNAGETAAQTV
jgi:hypothetical protein